MSSYEDVKVGDELFYVREVSIKHWGESYFKREFFLSCIVERVTKTQFVTSCGRYKKEDGRSIGGGAHILKLGDKPFWAKREVTRCESLDMANYGNEIKVIDDAMYFDYGKCRLTRFKSIETAQKVASLLMKIKGLIETPELLK